MPPEFHETHEYGKECLCCLSNQDTRIYLVNQTHPIKLTLCPKCKSLPDNWVAVGILYRLVHNRMYEPLNALRYSKIITPVNRVRIANGIADSEKPTYNVNNKMCYACQCCSSRADLVLLELGPAPHPIMSKNGFTEDDCVIDRFVVCPRCLDLPGSVVVWGILHQLLHNETSPLVWEMQREVKTNMVNVNWDFKPNGRHP